MLVLQSQFRISQPVIQTFAENKPHSFFASITGIKQVDSFSSRSTSSDSTNSSIGGAFALCRLLGLGPLRHHSCTLIPESFFGRRYKSNTVPRYSTERKNSVSKKSLPLESQSVPEISRAEVISEAMLTNTG